MAAALAPLQAAVAALEAAQARLEAEAAERTAEIERLRAERDRLVAERFADVTAQALATAETPQPAPPVPEPRMRVVTMAAAGRARARESEPAVAVLAVVDVDDTWEAAEIDAHRVVVVPPGDDTAARLRELAPKRVLANLAAPGTLATVSALRAGGVTGRVWGCLAAPTGDRVLPLGLIETAVRPLDAEAVLAVVERYAARGTRVVTAGADVDALMSLRQALSRGGMSVSMAWDATQATDLLGVVKPELVVIDLELPRREGYNIVARLAALDPVPAAVLVPGGGDAAGAFAAIVAQPVYSARCSGLRDVLARLLERSEAPPIARPEPPKVRVMTRK